MSDESTNTAHVAALAMLDAFASVGVERFDLTRTTRSGEKDYFRRGVAVAELRKAMPQM